MGKQKEFIGTVLESKMLKTIVVRVMRKVKHPKYGRIIKTNRKFKVHDQNNSAKPGDTVRIVQTRPLSKDKRFRLAQIMKKAEGTAIQVKDDAV